MRLSLLALPVASAFVIPQLVLDNIEEVYNHLSLDSIIENAASSKKPAYAELPPVDSESLQALITHENLNASAIELMAIANKSLGMFDHPTRVIGSPGHWKTLDWIRAQLDNMSDYYTYKTQEFDALDGKVFNYSLTVDFVKVSEVKPLALTPAAHVYGADVFVVDNYGCDDSDYDGINDTIALAPTKSVVALIKRGECAFGIKSSLAGKYGAKAALIYDPASTELVAGTLGAPTNTTVGTLAISNTVAEALIAKKKIGPCLVNMFIAAYVGIIKTKNIIADTIHGDVNNIVALGAHSDSVDAGPGINDDGSGTISLLNVAKALTNFQINNTVRFAWWAAEEEGLLGSNFYANNLTAEENQQIRLFMDYDMMASPNYQYQVYNGSNEVNPAGSEELKQLYIDYYESKGLDWFLIPFDGRSDYVGFIENNIPGGGIATGAEALNPFNNRAFDECYHQLCDDLDNIAWDAFLVNTQLIAHSVATFASDLTNFPARSPVKIETSSIKQFPMRGNHYII
ncbi:CYFA0S18e01750g1_1 [Cyberlindnera fabianii]|uniref:Peptide hydrolase n=1 Tax=Cyberlindnera fabianii TaxID=36022 RepID=A0A061B7S6_CYBFA|nr:Aminopeptidase Y [Cyberlindnera fabianii]CDR45440.1 CYFA0S18e01750g1_1 [Cyberlindnera fabianii]